LSTNRKKTADMPVTLFGIRNCDTVKKARAWLAGEGIAHDFHDYKTAGVDPDRLADWVGKFGWEKVLNRSGTTFRKLPDDEKADLDAAKALAILLNNPSAIRRPIVEHDGGVLLGFDAGAWEQALRPGG